MIMLEDKQTRWRDPVKVLRLQGKMIGTLPCPHMKKPRWRPAKRCNEQAVLLDFGEPYGLRARCEDGHNVPLARTAVPGGYRMLKGETD